MLITSWGRVNGIKHHQLEESVLERKLEYAQEYLAALDIVDGGISHNRGITLWEIHATKSYLANKRMQEERLAPVKFVEVLRECLEIVKEVQFSLQFNKEDSNEGEIRKAAVMAQQKLESGINAFNQMLGLK